MISHAAKARRKRRALYEFEFDCSYGCVAENWAAAGQA
jgi:hypothetical protein